MPVPTGVPVLDEMLRGGFPENRAVLLIGGPGTGKTTLGMQFLEDGLERGEECLLVSTEQTPAELTDSFAPYDFSLDHDKLSIETIHATLGATLEKEENAVVLDSLGDGEVRRDATAGGSGHGPSFGHYRAPFTSEYIQDVLMKYESSERVVFDSVSGLKAMTPDGQIFRRAILDFIRLFTDRFGATTLFTAEEANQSLNNDATSGMLQFNTHGVIRLWRERIEGDHHRFIQVNKMRGVDHETKAFEVEFDPHGVHVVPERWTPSTSTSHQYEPLSTGINGLDDLCGGGLIQGGTALLEHDGRANINPIIVNLLIEAVRRDQALVLLPPSNLEPSRLDAMISERIGSLDGLLESDQLFVLDLVGNWTDYKYNVFSITERDRLIRNIFNGFEMLMSFQMKRIFKTMNKRRGDHSALVITYTDAMLQELTPSEIRRIHQWGKKKLFYPEDTVLFIQNPRVMEDKLSEFFVLDSQQMLRTWMHDRGLQYLKLDKSPMGELGSSKLVKHVDYPPYIRVQRSYSQPRTTPTISGNFQNGE